MAVNTVCKAIYHMRRLPPNNLLKPVFVRKFPVTLHKLRDVASVHLPGHLYAKLLAYFKFKLSENERLSKICCKCYKFKVGVLKKD